MSTLIYRQDQEQPYAVYGPWEKWDITTNSYVPLDLSAETITLTLAVDDATAPVLTKESGITGTAAGYFTVAWGAGELNVAVNTYRVFAQLATGDRRFKPGDEPKIVIKATPAS